MKRKSAVNMSRRNLLQTGAGLALSGIVAPDAAVVARSEAVPQPGAPKRAKQSVYEALGVKHVINATGTVTILGGSLMPPEVVAAWADAARHFVNLIDLHDRWAPGSPS